ncbi:MAG: hypothetical protein ACI4EF_13475 [Coprococcus sp.]
MKTSVELQEPFSYAIWPMVIVGIIVVAMLGYYIIIKLYERSKRKQQKEVIVIKQKSPDEIAVIKQKYIEELDKIESDLNADKISIRAAYQKMSICIRRFVHEVTGIKVHHYTLQDIRTLNMPMLEELIVEYYAPEFSRKSIGNVSASIEKTKRVIERWN